MEHKREKSVEEELVQCQERLHALLLCLSAAPGEVDDLLQQTNLEILRHAEEYDTSRPAFPWFRKFAVLTVLNCRRRSRPGKLLFDNYLLEKLAQVSTPLPAHTTERSEKLEECLQKLPLWQRRLVEERHVKGEELSGLAARMRVTTTALSKMLWKIRDALRRCILKKEKPEHSPDSAFLRDMEQVFDGKASRETQEHFVRSLQHSSELRRLYREQAEIVALLIRSKRTAKKRKLRIAPIGIAASLAAFFAIGSILYKKPVATLPAETVFTEVIEQETSMKTNTIIETIALTALTLTAEPLVWNGGESGTWDKTQNNWLSGEEEVAWEDGSVASFPQKASVTLDGEISAGGIANADELSLNGGSLSLADGATLEIAGTLAVSSKLKSEGALAISSAPLPTYSGFLQNNSEALVFPGGTLAQIKGATAKMGGMGISKGTALIASTMYNYKYSGTSGTGQFQCMGGSTFVRCVRVAFTEKTDGVWAKALNACYNLNSYLGVDADVEKMTNTSLGTSLDTGGYGVCEIAVTASELSLNGDALFSGDVSLSGEALTIKAEGETETFTHPNFLTTTAADTVFTNMILANVELVSGTMGGTSINGGSPTEAATVHHVNFDGQTLTCQFQFGKNSWTKGIKVELKQTGGNVTARSVETYYYSKANSPGIDLENTSDVSKQKVATSKSTPGYGLATMTFRTKKVPSVAVSGANTCNNIVLDGAQMIFSNSNFLPPQKFSAINGAQVVFGGTAVQGADKGAGAEMYFGPGCTAVCTGNMTTRGMTHCIFDAATLYTPLLHPTVKDGRNYINNLTLKNGARSLGNPLRVGVSGSATTMHLSSEGKDLNVLASGLDLVNTYSSVSTNKLSIEITADLHISGDIFDYKDANSDLSGTTIEKHGAATLILSGKNTFAGKFTLAEGVVRVAGANAIPAQMPLVLAGGALECGGNTIAPGVLTLTGNSTIALQQGGIAFADSSAAEWDSSATLTITGEEDLPTKTVRFGTSADALTGTQLRQIRYNGEQVALDRDGYLKNKPTGTVIYLLN